MTSSLSLLHLMPAQPLLFTLSSLMHPPSSTTTVYRRSHPQISSRVILLIIVVLPTIVLIVILPPSASPSSSLPLLILISQHPLLRRAHLAPHTARSAYTHPFSPPPPRLTHLRSDLSVLRRRW